ncbi:MBL fold metallo-hydrolase [Leptospira levettii]|uniref:MBL fold metallo-hydrolase n=1 Tax=Leptospira levettii TaxID=2023178 RepID=UPI0010833B49|nr:MBL fold metallo-hydrolase [Leptospira levettii]MCW7506798.1 MBL fold metallo-hydrolase [Leptospira levettii]MCW7517888.1 MBL fold metallo-hydrolase [Leptospira levettii]TGK99699.1 MBL fold metallo-hydrolase [Leptospira levettii]
MKITLFGVRGSLPTPISKQEQREKTLKILHLAKEEWKKDPNGFSEEEFLNHLPIPLSQDLGGNTTCVFIEGDGGERVILDMGTGLRVLGNQLAPEAFSGKEMDIHILVSHTHWDHIQGWPFFKPGYSPSVNIHFYSCIPNLEERLERQQHPENFPVTFQQMASKKHFHLWKEFESYMLGGLKIIPFGLRHPGSCTGYRIREGNKIFLFCTDVEYREEDREHLLRMKPQIAGADLIIIDAQYSTSEAEKKIGWGHTAVSKAVEFAEMMEIRSVVLTHHEPDHTDHEVARIILDEARLLKPGGMQVHIAHEGQKFIL